MDKAYDVCYSARGECLQLTFLHIRFLHVAHDQNIIPSDRPDMFSVLYIPNLFFGSVTLFGGVSERKFGDSPRQVLRRDYCLMVISHL